MMLTQKKLHRLCIYVFFDAQGKADRYVKYFLEQLQSVVDDTIVVVNGNITDESKAYIKPYVKDILVRENKGYDISAYKHGLQTVGYEKLKEYDEVIVCNDTMFGPVYPFSEMFDSMSSRDLDFWGVTRHGNPSENVFECKYGYMPEHIQSYFIVFRQSLVQADCFKEYWETLPLITDRDSAIGTFETMYTKHFEDLGYKWDAYVDATKFERIDSINPCFLYADSFVERARCPLFKKKLFVLEYDYFYDNHIEGVVASLYKYLLSSGTYDVSMIWENILRLSPQADYSKNLQLSYTVSDSVLDNALALDYKCAVVLRVNEGYDMRAAFDILSRFDSNFDIYITTNINMDVLAMGEEYHLNIAKVIDASHSLGYVVKEYLSKYDIVCSIDTTSESDIEKLSSVVSNIAGSDIQVQNILKLFGTESNLGMLCYSDVPTITQELKFYKKNYDIVKAKCGELGLNVPIKQAKCHIMPKSNCMWFRPSIFSKVTTLDGVTADYYSLIAQDAGYFTAYIRSNDTLGVSITDIHKATKKVYKPTICGRIKAMVGKCTGFWKRYGFVKLVKRVFRVIKKKLLPKSKKDKVNK